MICLEGKCNTIFDWTLCADIVAKDRNMPEKGYGSVAFDG